MNDFNLMPQNTGGNEKVLVETAIALAAPGSISSAPRFPNTYFQTNETPPAL
jgi:hypothetical protein